MFKCWINIIIHLQALTECSFFKEFENFIFLRTYALGQTPPFTKAYALTQTPSHPSIRTY